MAKLCRLLALTCALTSFASAQTTTLFSFDFQSDAASALPSGWSNLHDPHANVVENIFLTGNSSTRALVFSGGTGGADLHTPTVNLAPYASATSFTLSFDYYQNVGTESSLLIGFNATTDGRGFKWVGADSQTVGLGTLDFRFDPTTAATWQHFNIDVTAAVASYLNGVPSTDFSMAFQNWLSGAAGGAQELYLDNITLTATASAIPEPSTYAAFAGVAALGLAVYRKRRRALC
jgi:hypothetical protein